MPVSGYDPDDLEDRLAELLAEHDRTNFLTDEEYERFEAGERLLDILDAEDIERLRHAESGASST